MKQYFKERLKMKIYSKLFKIALFVLIPLIAQSQEIQPDNDAKNHGFCLGWRVAAHRFIFI